MGKGVRIAHPTLRNTEYVVPILDRPIPGGPLHCHKCEKDYPTKHYHFDLDDQGAVIVSETVLEEMTKVGMAKLEVQNEVLKPPPIGIAMADFAHDKKRDPRKFKPVEITRGRRKGRK